VFSIVTANWNGEKLLNIFFESLINQKYKDFRIYIVDNGSSDNSIEVINSYKSNLDINVIELDNNYGFAKANNIGINEAMKDGSEYIITLNNDLELDKNCLCELNSKLTKLNGKYDVFQILLLNFYDRDKIDAAGLSFNKYHIAEQTGYKNSYKTVAERNNIDGVCAGAAVYSKKCLKSVKINQDEYFDSQYFAYYEDVDLSLRLTNAGFMSYLITEAVAYHVQSGTSGKDSYFKSYYLSRNLQLYLKKNLSEEVYKKNRKVYLFYFIKIIVRSIIKLKPGVLYGTCKGYSDYRKLIKK